MNKNMTSRALAANRQNATKSTGPTSAIGKMTVGRNALKHGLLAKTLQFKSEEEQNGFEELLNTLVRECRPQGVVQCAIVEEIAMCLWKLGVVADLEGRELSIRTRTTQLIMRAFAEQSQQSVPLTEDEMRRKLRGFECKELLLRLAVAEDEEEEKVSDFDDKGREQKRERVQLEARLGSSLDTTMRYTAALKRDLYRAIDKLEALQHSRTMEGKRKEP